MAEITLNLLPRTNTGTQNANRARREGKIPGIYYFHGHDNVPFQVDKKELLVLKTHESGLINMVLNGETNKCVVREIQFDPIHHSPIHLDLMGISMKEKIHVTIPIHLIGTAIGVKNGGILQQIIREINVECYPSDMPERIEVDVTNLDIGHSLALRDVHADKIKILADENLTLANVAVPRAAEEKAPTEVTEEEGKEPELVGKKEKEEGEEA